MSFENRRFMLLWVATLLPSMLGAHGLAQEIFGITTLTYMVNPGAFLHDLAGAASVEGQLGALEEMLGGNGEGMTMEIRTLRAVANQGPPAGS